ncbi:hypothetical protein NBRC111894_1601 [Sporolactobacillus inulinus]|uniref:Uncharacterized protein n=1 Tax=Sporolactobacillus inulinus TaxID=2078 RepID=A0A4Y1ZAG5_9BACL|nr:hypothetical protein NBRC111894_1601 [Sporolactobacillus inulinus]
MRFRPFLPGNTPHQCLLDFKDTVLPSADPQSFGYPFNMCVNRQCGFTKCYRDNHICCFSSNAGKFDEFVTSCWQLTIILLNQHLTHLPYMFCLITVKTNRAQIILEFSNGYSQIVLRFVIFLKKTRGDAID